MKKIGVFIAVIVICLITNTIVYAEDFVNNDEKDSNDIISGDSMEDSRSNELIENKTLEDQLEDIFNDPYISKSNKSQAIEKVESLKNIELKILEQDSNKINVNARVADYTLYQKTVILPVTGFKQEQSYYCGPATLKQTMNYMMGKSLPQNSYARILGTTTAGTDGTRIVDYINKNGCNPYFIYKVGSGTVLNSANALKEMFYINLYENKSPLILRINNIGNSSEWGYETEGHFLNLSGYVAKDYTGLSSRIGKFEVTDPASKWQNQNQKNYVSVDAIYYALNNHFAKHFYV